MDWNVFAQRCVAMANVHACDVCLASDHEHGILQDVCVREHAVLERFLRVCEYDVYLCDCANAHELPLHVYADVNDLHYL